VIGWESREAHFEAKGKPGGELLVLASFLIILFFRSFFCSAVLDHRELG